MDRPNGGAFSPLARARAILRLAGRYDCIPLPVRDIRFCRAMLRDTVRRVVLCVYLEEPVSHQHHDSEAVHERSADGLTRARLLRNTAAAALVGLSPSLLSQASAFAATTPKKGGALRVGCVGGGTAETVNPFLGVTPIDQCRIQNLYDPLVIMNSDLSRSPGLALEWNHNKTSTVYEVKLRQGVEFHNGKSFGADDVIYSIKQMAGKTSARAAVRVGHPPRRAEGDRQAHGADHAEGARRRSGRQLRLLQHVDRPGRAEGLQAPGRHRRRSSSSRSRPASRACSSRTRTTG